MFLLNNKLLSRLAVLGLVASVVACSDDEKVSKRSQGTGIGSEKVFAGASTEDAKGSIAAQSTDTPMPVEGETAKGSASQTVTQQPVADTDTTKGTPTTPPVTPVVIPCKYYNPAAPNFTVAKDQFGVGLPPREMPSSQIKGTLQPDQKTFIGEFDLWKVPTPKGGHRWELTDVNNSMKYHYAYVITNADSDACTVAVRLVDHENRNNGGCFAATTQIRMANGSDMMIALITVGDLVYNPATSSSARVAEVVKGPENNKSMYKISVGSRQVTVTSAHPFATTAGMKQAQQLVAGDRILARDGSYEAITAATKLPLSATQTVVNLRLEGDASEEAHMLFADGIVTGDLYLQRVLEN